MLPKRVVDFELWAADFFDRVMLRALLIFEALILLAVAVGGLALLAHAVITAF